MKKFKNLFEQHRNVGAFRPIKPKNVKSVPNVSPRPYSDSASALQKQDISQSNIREETDELDKPVPTVDELANKYNLSVADMEELVAAGTKVEMEHTDDKKVARRIALAHLKEKKDYYKKLKKYVEDVGIYEDLRQWFDPKHPKGGWKRINSKGEAIGPCAREPGEAKPKCMSNEKRAKLSKKERASAVAAKRRHDPVADRSGKGGKPVNVSNFGKGKLSEEMEQLDEKNVPTNPSLWSRAKALARSKFDVYPSAYANGWASKWYKSKGGGWKSVNEEVEQLDELGKIKVNFKMPPESAAEKFARRHAEIRKKSGLPHPDEYKKNIEQKQKEIDALRKEETMQKAVQVDTTHDTIASRTYKEKPNKQPMEKMKESILRKVSQSALKESVNNLKPFKESLNESRKAEIVKEIVKKKKKKDETEKSSSDDKFQPDPILSSDLTKQ